MAQIKTVGIAGGGTMGTGIAIVAARAGFVTRVYDTRQEALERARGQAESFLRKSAERGKLPADAVPEIMSRWHGTTKLDDLADCDVVIEAVFEDLAVKHQLFSAPAKVSPAHTLFASNTSPLSLTEFAGG